MLKINYPDSVNDFDIDFKQLERSALASASECSC